MGLSGWRKVLSAAGRLIVLGLTVAALWVTSLPAAAQGSSLTISEATLRLYPEYDDPGLLVIFSGSIANISNYPQDIAFQVPANARGIQATEQDATQTLMNRQWQRTGGQISYELESLPTFHLEYYLDRPPSGNDRAITYSWQAPYSVKSLTIIVEQPARSTSFSLTPKEESTFQSSDGLTSYQMKRADVAPGDKIDLAIRYTKTDQTPSFASNQQQTAGGQNLPASQTQVDAAAQAATGTNPWAFILIGTGIAALAGAAVYWFIEQRRMRLPAIPQQPSRRAHAGNASGRRISDSDVGSESRYCPKCGRAFQPEDNFCGNCGTPR